MRGQFADALVEDTAARKPNEARHKKLFENYLLSGNDKELRDFLAGTESITYTNLASGGATVPIAYDDTLRKAMAQVDPILDENVTSFSMGDSESLQPHRISGYDLSTIAALATIDGVASQASQLIPPVAGAGLKANLVFKTTLGCTQEIEQDAAEFGNALMRAGETALARAIGRSAISGQGGTDILGIARTIGITPGLQTTPGKLVLADLLAYYFSINAFYRNSPKAAWMMNDGAYKVVRNAQDNQGRPLINVSGDDLTLLGHPVYISPSLVTPFVSIGFLGAIIFGDLASIVIKTNRPVVKRIVQASIVDITQGKSAYIFRCRADASYFDPSSGANPPLVMGAVN